MVQSLNKKWKELLFAFSGFGPNFLMVLMGAYYTDALNPVALGEGDTYQAILSGTCFILPALFSILFAIGKAFDGIIDIPFAYLTDTLSTKWGRRRPAILVCSIPMIISYTMCWIPVVGPENQLINTLWFFVWNIIFFATYTMCLIAFYGSLSTTCSDEPQRLRVSTYKSFFDTISYCLVYALVPLLLDVMKIHIDKFVFLCLPLMLTILIPLFMIKEGAKYGYPENDGLSPEKVSIWESLKLTFQNRLFLRWTLINCCTFFGLQMFLVGMNAMILGGMGFNGLEMALVNTCAFAPVPVMLYLFNKLKAKKGIRFTYQTCLLAFAVAILSFFFSSLFVTGGNKPLQYVIACAGGVLGSWAIGAFFMMPYLVPAQISSVEEKLTGKNHSAMYFAGNAVTTSIVGAISGTLIYENIKTLFFAKGASGILSAENYEEAAARFGVEVDSVFNFGTLIVPFVVAAVCVLGYILAFGMPRDYTPVLVARELKKQDPSLDISQYEAEADKQPAPEKEEILFVQIGLFILSGTIFGFIWQAFLLRAMREFNAKRRALPLWLLCTFIPFASAFVVAGLHNDLCAAAERVGTRFAVPKWLCILLCILFPILPVNFIVLALLQHGMNKIYRNTAA